MRRTAVRLTWIVAIAGVVTLVWAGLRSASLSSQAATPVTLYVDLSSIGGACSDSHSLVEAQSPTMPLCTIGQGIALAPAGSTVFVRAGAYPALAVNGGDRDALVTVAAYQSETVSLPNIAVGSDTSFLRFQGLHLTGDANVSDLDLADGSHDIQLTGSDVASQTQDAISLHVGVSNVLIDSDHISSKAPGATDGGDGIAFDSTSTLPGSPDGQPSDAPISNVTISNNHFDNIGVDAIRPANFVGVKIEGNDITGINENGEHTDAIQTVFGGSDLDIESNYIHNNAGEGILIKDGEVTGARIANNVIVHTTAEIQIQVFDTIGLSIVSNTLWDNELNIVLRPGVRNGVIRDNIFQDEVAEDPVESAANVTQDYNLVASGWNWGARGPHDITTPPTFVDAAHGDYRLSSHSAGVDAGDAASAPQFDKACRARYDAPGVANTGTGSPAYVDMGALEYSPDSQPGGTSAPFDPSCATPPPPCTCTTPPTGSTPTGTPPPATTPTTTPTHPTATTPPAPTASGRASATAAAGATTAAAGSTTAAAGGAAAGQGEGGAQSGVLAASTARPAVKCGWLTLGSLRSNGKGLALKLKARKTGTFTLSGRLVWRGATASGQQSGALKSGALKSGALLSKRAHPKKGQSLTLQFRLSKRDFATFKSHRSSARLRLTISGSSAGALCTSTATLRPRI